MGGVISAEHRYQAVEKIRKKERRRGLSTGFQALDEIVTLRKGYPIFVAGAPHHGKSQFVKQILINTSVAYGWKHLLYCGEEGTVDELILDLIEIYKGNPARIHRDDGTKNIYSLGEGDFGEAFQFISEHFYFIEPDELDPEKPFDVGEFYRLCDEFSAESGVKFDSVLIDPWNDLDMNLGSYGGRQDLHLADALKRVRNEAKKHNRIDWIVNHIADVRVQYVTDQGRRFAPPALPQEWSGGQTWHRRAFTMLLVYRPPAPDSFKLATKGETVNTVEGESWIINQKVKPKGSGKLGRAKLHYLGFRFYEFVDGIRREALVTTHPHLFEKSTS